MSLIYMNINKHNIFSMRKHMKHIFRWQLLIGRNKH